MVGPRHPLQVLDHVLVVLLRRVHERRAPNQVDGAQVGARVGEELDDVLVPVGGRLCVGSQGMAQSPTLKETRRLIAS